MVFHVFQNTETKILRALMKTSINVTWTENWEHKILCI